MKKALLLSFILLSGITSTIFANDVPQKTIPMTNLLKTLESSGYSIVRDVKYDDGMYKIDAINAQGKDVEAKVNPMTGDITQTKDGSMKLTILNAARKVEDSGYKNIYSIESSGDKFKVKALGNDGKKVSLTIDGETGKVSKDLF
jgi:hypothetical protein